MGLESKHAYRFGFLKSEEWKLLRLGCLARDGAKCRLCKSRNLSNDAHHIRYPKNWFDTCLCDLVTLCRRCHDSVHAYMEANPGHSWDVIRKKVSIPGVVNRKPGRHYIRIQLDKVANRGLVMR